MQHTRVVESAKSVNLIRDQMQVVFLCKLRVGSERVGAIDTARGVVWIDQHLPSIRRLLNDM